MAIIKKTLTFTDTPLYTLQELGFDINRPSYAIDILNKKTSLWDMEKFYESIYQLFRTVSVSAIPPYGFFESLNHIKYSYFYMVQSILQTFNDVGHENLDYNEIIKYSLEQSQKFMKNYSWGLNNTSSSST